MKRMCKRSIVVVAVLLAALFVANLVLADEVDVLEGIADLSKHSQISSGGETPQDGTEDMTAPENTADPDDPDDSVDSSELDDPDQADESDEFDETNELDETGEEVDADEFEDCDKPEETEGEAPEDAEDIWRLSVRIDSIRDGIMRIGDNFYLKATLSGFAGLNYTVQWQYDAGDELGWINIQDDGELEYQLIDELTLSVVSDLNNVNYNWRILVTPILEAALEGDAQPDAIDAE